MRDETVEYRANCYKSLFQELAPGIEEIHDENATLLGSPLSEEAISSILNEKISKFKQLSSRLDLLSSHSAFYILRASVSIPCLIYFLRCAPCWKVPQLLSTYDNCVQSSLE